MENLPHSLLKHPVIYHSCILRPWPVPVSSTIRNRFFIHLHHHNHHKLVFWLHYFDSCCIQSGWSPVWRGVPSALKFSSQIEETAFRTMINPFGLDWYKLHILHLHNLNILYFKHILCLNHLNIQLVLESNYLSYFYSFYLVILLSFLFSSTENARVGWLGKSLKVLVWKQQEVALWKSLRSTMVYGFCSSILDVDLSRMYCLNV